MNKEYQDLQIKYRTDRKRMHISLALGACLLATLIVYGIALYFTLTN